MSSGAALSVITPVSRPRNLRQVGSCIPLGAEWIVVTDGHMEIPHGVRTHTLISGPHTASYGDVQRRIGLSKATRPFVYFLDDDNLMLPRLPDILIPFLDSCGASGVMFGLLAHYFGTANLWPAPLSVQKSRVDTAMFFGRRDLALKLKFGDEEGDYGWPDLPGERHADFVFLSTFDAAYSLKRLPMFLGFHNGLDYITQFTPTLLLSCAASPVAFNETLEDILNRALLARIVPPWYSSEGVS